MFLHYIDVKDPDAENKKYDGRHMLGIDVLIKKKKKTLVIDIIIGVHYFLGHILKKIILIRLKIM